MADYPEQAVPVVVQALEGWAAFDNATYDEIARFILTSLVDADWRILYPANFPGLCSRCNSLIEDGTQHVMFNGNQMFACEIIRDNNG